MRFAKVSFLARLAGGTGTAAGIWMLTLLAAGMRRAAPAPSNDTAHGLVLVPAHNEEESLSKLLESLGRQEFGTPPFDIVVVAHNCSDGTAEIAEAGGAQVWERIAPDDHGKGAALGWALARLSAQGAVADFVVVIDADCVCSSNVVRAIGNRIAAGASAVQVRNVIDPPADTHGALRAAAFLLVNVARPLGLTRLGVSAGLRGTGMAFSRQLLDRMPWTAESLAEDLEQHLTLACLGERVEYLDEAEVRSPLPRSRADRRVQFKRWEGGRIALLAGPITRTLHVALEQRRPKLAAVALDAAVPPQANLMILSLGALAGGAVSRDRLSTKLALFSMFAQSTYVIAGLRLAGAPRSAYKALLLAPLIVLEKLRLYTELLTRGLPAWQRSGR